jgi:methylornithine synthase
MYENVMPLKTKAATMEQMDAPTLSGILNRILGGSRPTEAECLQILKIKDPVLLKRVFETACALRQRHFGNQVFLYGFLYFSTYCRNACRFCNYRSTNSLSARYRKSPEEIISAAGRFSDQVHLVDLTMGEDPMFFDENGRGFDALVDLVRSVKTASGLPVMVSPGAVPARVLKQMKLAGADWFACYQETHNPALFKALRAGQDYTDRWDLKRSAARMGLLVEEGILCGVGETDADIVDSLKAMAHLDADQIRVMQFVPQEGTPMAEIATNGFHRELLVIALLRLMFPDRLIPASLDVEGLSGLETRLLAGANVVTSIVPPQSGFMGVSQSELDIDTAKRSPGAVDAVLERCGLVSASTEGYLRWVKGRVRGKRAGDGAGR